MLNTGGVFSKKTKSSKVHEDITRHLASPGPVPKDCVRFVCISDTHSRVEHTDFVSRVPDGDVLLHAGDFTLHGEIDEYVEFNDFLEKLPHPIKLAIPGNHEVSLDPRGLPYSVPCFRKSLGLPMCLESPTESNYRDVVEKLLELLPSVIILIDSFVSVCGIKIYGLPWLPQHGAPGFGLRRPKQLEAKQKLIPEDTNILLSHGPPRGYGDLTSHNRHVGSVELARTIRGIKPRYVVMGHIHEGYGVYSDETTTYINAAICNKIYRPTRDPIVFDFPLPQPFTRDNLLGLKPQDLTVTHCS